MGDEGDFWRYVKAARKAKRAANTVASTDLLTQNGIEFESKNFGAHLFVSGRFDFWPSSGLYIDRATGKRSRGVMKLIAQAKK